MFNMGREGIKSHREVDSIFTALSLVGGFATCMFYGTYYTYWFITGPITELKLAYAFEKIVQNHKDINSLHKDCGEEEEVETLRSCRFRTEYLCFKRVCCLQTCRKRVRTIPGLKIVEHL